MAVGVLHPDHLLHALTATQLAGWMQFYKQRPFGEAAQDARYGRFFSFHHNSKLTKKDQHKSKKPAHFIPWPDPYKVLAPMQNSDPSAIMRQATLAFAAAGIKERS